MERRVKNRLLSFVALFCATTLAAGTARGDWSDDFDTYDTGSTIAGQGDWWGWDKTAGVDADIVDEQFFSEPNSMRLRTDSDMVQMYSGYNKGVYLFRAMTYVPSDHSGETWIIMLDTYNHGSTATKHWAHQTVFTGGHVSSVGGDYAGSGYLPWIADEWVPYEVEIDLDLNVQRIWYGGQFLDELGWQIGGLRQIQAIDLYSATGSAFYFDDVSMTAVTVPDPLRDVSVTGNCPDPAPVQVTIRQALPAGADPSEVVTVTEMVYGAATAAQIAAANGGTAKDLYPKGVTPGGFITDWLLLGPYTGTTAITDAPTCPVMQLDYLTDGSLGELDVFPVDGETIFTDFGVLAASSGLSGPAWLNPDGVPTWHAHHDTDDSVNFNTEHYMGDYDNVMMYAFTYIHVDAEVDVDFCTGSDDSLQVLVDGNEILCSSLPRGWGYQGQCQDTTSYVLDGGEHTIMVKVFEGAGGHGFRLGIKEAGTDEAAPGISVCLTPDATPPCALPGAAVISWNVTRQQVATGVSYTIDANRANLRFEGDVARVRTKGDSVSFVCPPATDAQGLFTDSQFIGIGPFTHPFQCGDGLDTQLLGNHIANAEIRSEYPSAGDTIDYDASAAVTTSYIGRLTRDGKPFWRAIDDGGLDGPVDLNVALGNRDDVMGFLVTYVEYTGAQATQIQLCLGTDDGGQLWWDCDLVGNTRRCQGYTVCNVGTFPVTVEPGIHRIAAGAWDYTGGWTLGLRMLQADGSTPIVDGDPNWKFLGGDRPAGYTPPVCQGCAPEPVTNLTCVAGKCGAVDGVVLTWTNPEITDDLVPTRIEVNGTEVLTVASDATTACVPAASLPQGIYEISVIHCGGTPAICSPFKTNSLGQIRDSAWLALGPYVNAGNGCDDATGDTMRLNSIAPSTIECLYPVEGDEVPFDLTAEGQSSTGYLGRTGTNGQPVVERYDDALDNGDLDMDASYGEQNNVVTWVVTYVEYTGAPGQVKICASTDDSASVWLNDQAVITDPACRGRTDACDSSAVVDVEPGAYRIAFAAWENEGDWGGRLALRDAATDAPILDDGTSDWIFHGTERPPAASFPGGFIPCQVTEKQFHRGDPNNDGTINITDGIYILNFLFLGGPKPTCQEAANPNDDATVNITDGIYVLNFLFLGGPPPASPGPATSPCGPDPAGSPSNLGCETYTKC